jgi:nitrite reductase (NO-forming)
MSTQSTKSVLATRVAYLRIAFGIIWAIDAAFKWQTAFIQSFLGQVTDAAQGQPAWLHFWFTAWQNVLSLQPNLFAYGDAVVETLIALALIFGFAKRITYIGAIVFSLLLWSIPEGFGGPYSSASTDVGTGIIYAVVFFALYGLEQLAGESKYCVDEFLKRRISWWYYLADPAKRP